MLDFEVILSKKDYRKFRYFNEFARKKAFSILSLVLILVILLNVIAYYPNVYNPAIVVCGAGLVLIWLVILIKLNISINNFITTDRITIGKLQKIDLDNEEITIYTELTASTMKYRWNKVFLAYETNNYIYIYINLQSAIIVPKSCIDLEKQKILKDILSSKLGKNFKNERKVQKNQEEQTEAGQDLPNKSNGIVKVIAFIAFLALYILLCFYLRDVLNDPKYSNDLKATMEYNGDEYNAEKDFKKIFGSTPSYEIGTNKYGYVVFKDPQAAFEQIKLDCGGAFSVIKDKYSLKDVENRNIKDYANYATQVTTKDFGKSVYEQAIKIQRFWNIYKESFDQMYR